MSRVGKVPVVIPDNVQASVREGFFEVQGPKGILRTLLHKGVVVKIDNNSIIINPLNEDARPMWGTTRSIINNLVAGVSVGFTSELEIVGVGYRMAVKDNFINLSVGKSHSVKIFIPEGITVSSPKANVISIHGIDKQRLGQFVATIIRQKPSEPFKGKGIKFKDQIIKRKEGKKS